MSSSLPAGLVLIGLGFPLACQAQSQEPVKGEATFSSSGGYARLVLTLAEDVESEVSTAGSIIVIRFKRPVDIPVGKLPEAVPDYVSSVRRDPDGSAIRLSLVRRVTINTMTAGEKIFVDFLPDSWTGPPPSLPGSVIRELAERARAAERALRAQRAAELASKKPAIRVRASVQPTFVRFVVDLPDNVGVSSVLNEQKLTLLFNSVLMFDLSDAKVAAPPNVASINQRSDVDSSAIEITLIGDVDVHSFREEKSYVVDVAFQRPEKPLTPDPLAAAAPQALAPAVSAPRAKEASSQQQVPAAPVAAEKRTEPAHTEVKPAPPSAAPVEVAAAPPEKIAPPAEKAEPPADRITEAAPKAAPAAEQTPVPQPVNPAAAEVAKPAPAKEASTPAMEAPAKPAAPASELKKESRNEVKPAAVDAQRDSDGLRVKFSFAAPTAAALFRRANTVWLVFDSTTQIDLAPIREKGGPIIGDVSALPLEKGQAIRIRLNLPRMPAMEADDSSSGQSWTVVFADKVRKSSQPLTLVRNVADPAVANVSVPLENPGLLHPLVDPDVGDTLLVITASPPPRGFIKRQDFVELSLLESAHGIVIDPHSDDVKAEVGADKVMIGRPGGLTLSSADVAPERATAMVRPLFDVVEWRKNQAENFFTRLDALVVAAGLTPPEHRAPARLDLANFYMARGMYHEARSVTDLILADTKPGHEDSVAMMVHAVSSMLIGRPEQALKDIADPVIGNSHDSQMWKGLALARQGKWAEAREKFKNVEFSVAALPADMQRIVMMESMRALLEVKDFAGAARVRSELEAVGIPEGIKPAIAVLFGRLAEGLGHDKDALDAYRFAANASDRQAAAEARLLEVDLRHRRGELGQAEALAELEALSVLWRGDGIEIKTLQLMAKIYSETARYADAFAATRTATRLQPNSELSRQAQDAAAALFSDLFLGTKGDDMPPVDALGIFYQYRELTPIGRRGDEMIRRLADRLVRIDLLDQAAELLQYQVDKRLEGAARAQVAARLAMVYLANRKPDRAIAALRSTRMTDLSGELRQQRLLLEARAQSDIGRHDLGLEIISKIPGREAIRLRSDIHWASRQWREAAEQIELYYAERWRDFRPLNAAEKSDIIRAVVGYALAEDAIGLARFREKYAVLMAADADRQVFEAASRPVAANSSDFGQIAKLAASVDTLDGFIRDMKARFPDSTARAPLPDPTPTGAVSGIEKPEPAAAGSLPQIVGLKRVSTAQ